MNERGRLFKKSEIAAGKNIVYCPACYQNYDKLFPIVEGSLRRDMFYSNCKTHYTLKCRLVAIHHLADQMIPIDLDKGEKVNYTKFHDVLAKIK